MKLIECYMKLTRYDLSDNQPKRKSKSKKQKSKFQTKLNICAHEN